MTPELLITWTILLGALVAGWFAVRLVRDWRKQQPAPGPTVAEQLEHFRLLHEQGELSAAEFARIQQKLGTDSPPTAPSTPPADGSGSADGIQADRPGA